LTVLTSWLLQSFGDSSLLFVWCCVCNWYVFAALCCWMSVYSTASAIDMLWQFYALVAWDRFCDWYALEVSSWSSLFFFEDHLASLLPGCRVLTFIFVGFLIVLLLPVMGLKSVVVVLSMLLGCSFAVL
jgi:hypothetical protein